VEYLFVCFVFGLSTGLVGRTKGSSFSLWFLIGAILPGIGLLAALLYRVERNEPRRACPGCGKIVPLHDALCTRCGTELEFPAERLPGPDAEPVRR
jgi:peptidoglycan/LPS O-acetylase OafA/YrhL